MKKLLNKPLPPCLKDKIIKAIKELNRGETTDGKIQIKDE